MIQELPKEMIIPDYLERLYSSDREYATKEISDWVSDETGFCHDGFEIIKTVNNKELEDLKLIRKRNCESFAYELTERERYKLLTNTHRQACGVSSQFYNRHLEELWKKKVSCFMVNGKFEEIEKVLKR